MTLSRLTPLLCAFIAALCVQAATPKVSTRRNVGKSAAASPAVRTSAALSHAADFDTLRIAPRDTLCPVRAAGYDKPLNSRYETLHLSNLTDSLTILAVGLRIDYIDLDGRTLHSRTAEVRTVIPPLSTRLGRFRSWDSQQSFYYVNGRRPRTDRVTPYDIALSIEYIVKEKKKSPQTVDN